MGWKKTAAEKLDTAAGKLHHTGKKIGGKTGGQVGDAVANAVLAPVRNRIDVDCTHKGGCTHR